MSIFDTIAKTFGPKAKAPTIDTLERLEHDAAAAVTAARSALEVLEAGRTEAVLSGDAARAEYRAKLAAARDDVVELEAALEAVKGRLEQARVEAEEKGRMEAYTRAKAAQQAAADAVLAKYEEAAGVLRSLAKQVAEADAAVEAANRDLPGGVERLLQESEALVRDIPGQPREVVRTDIVELWCGSGGAPVDDQRAVVSRDGRTGHVTIATGFGSHAVPVHRQTFEKRRVRPWTGPLYGERLRDLNLPPLRSNALPAAAEVEELEPIAQPAVAAE